jgi:hypothetical protein
MKPKDPGAQTDPFAPDPAGTIIDNPVEGIALSHEFKHTRERADCPITDAHAAHWQEHSFDVEIDPNWAAGYCVEMARFVAPPGMQGHVSIVETALLLVPDPGPPATGACYCPWFYDYLNGFLDPIVVAFHLRLDSYKRLGSDPAPLQVPSYDSLPGHPHPALGEWHDARYDYGRQRGHVSLFVPDGYYLRLFCSFMLDRVIPFTRLWGRLAGITQNYRGNPSAIFESRKWPG